MKLVVVIIALVIVVSICLFSFKNTFKSDCSQCREQIQNDINECVNGVCPLKKK